jgi:hypothetical protein
VIGVVIVLVSFDVENCGCDRVFLQKKEQLSEHVVFGVKDALDWG